MKLKPIPAEGIIGEGALREAAATDFGQVTTLVRAALTRKTRGYPDIRAIFPARVILSSDDGRFLAYDYAIDDSNQVKLGEPVEVVVEWTDVAMREAAAAEFCQVMDLLRGALKAHYGLGNDNWICLKFVYPDRVVVERNGRNIEFPYTISDDNEVSLGKATEVVLETKPAKPGTADAVRESVGARMAEAAGGFIEALAADASKPARYLVRVIRSGVSLNSVDYPASVLREAAPLFDRVRVFAKSDNDHLAGKRAGKDFRQLIGRLVEPKFVEAKSGGGEIQAILEVLETADVAAKLREAVTHDMTDLFGLSIDASGASKVRGKFREATKLLKVDSVDLIIEPGAGGQIIRFAEAHQEPDMLRQKMLDQIRSRDAKRADALVNSTDDEIITAYRECVGTGEPERPAGGLTAADVDARIRMIEARANARTAIAGSRLPAPLQERLQERFTEAAEFTAADVDAAITAERTMLTRLVEAGSGAQVRGLGRIEITEDQSQKVTTMLDDFFDPSKTSGSFRECYGLVTGDWQVTGLIRNCDMSRLREAAGGRFVEAISAATWSDILGDSITRAMIRNYGQLEAYRDWRWAVDVVPVNDFRTQERTRMGGYGNLPVVAESGPYNPLSSPGDDKATYKLDKRGGTETITLETISNDDVGAIRRVPLALATSAGRTLYEFVYDFFATNPTVYDGLALFVAGHNNLGTAALAAASFAASRLRIKRQTELSSNKRLGLTLRHLVVPADLEEAAFDLFVRGTNQDETFVQSRKPTVHVVDYWTDANNWFATADLAQAPMIQLGFYGGNEEPELFVQDSPTQGSLFSNDQIKYKIRHIYSGTVLDYRGLDGSIVA